MEMVNVLMLVLSVFLVSANLQAFGPEAGPLTEEESVWLTPERQLKKADDELNRVYLNLLNRVSVSYSPSPELGESLKSHIRKAQRAWIDLRDETCQIQAFFIDPAAPAFEQARVDCLVHETEIRTQYLGSLQY